MELEGLLCSKEFAGDNCELNIYEFEGYKRVGDNYSGTARFELSVVSNSNVNDLKEEYRNCSIYLLFSSWKKTFLLRWSRTNRKLWENAEELDSKKSCENIYDCGGPLQGFCDDGQCVCNV